MAESPPRRLIIKIGSAGDVHLDFKPGTLEQMQAAVAELNQAGGIVVYYAESAYQQASDAAMATFKKLLELKPRILMGNNAVSEWGRLDWVEVQRNPAVSRFFFRRGEKFLLSPAATPDQPKQRVLVGGPMTASNDDTLFKMLDLVIRCARVVETPQQAPEMAMEDKAVTTPSLHIRLGYAARRWASAYAGGEIPANITSFERDVWWVASHTLANLEHDARRLTGQAAIDFFAGPHER
jgi:hypothetical protein